MTDSQEPHEEHSEDLFNFDDLAAVHNSDSVESDELETSVSEDAQLSESGSPSALVQSDDLFDFDDLVDSPSIPTDEEVRSLDDLLEGLPNLNDSPTDISQPTTPRQASKSAEDATGNGDKHSAEDINVLVRGARSPLTLAGIAVLAAINLALIGVTWKSNKNLRQEVQEVAVDFLRQAEVFNNKTDSQIDRIQMAAGPIVSDDPGQQQTFANVLQDFERGDYPLARRRLYSLLSILDRLEPTNRKDVESRARFFLADSLRLQALAETGVTP